LKTPTPEAVNIAENATKKRFPVLTKFVEVLYSNYKFFFTVCIRKTGGRCEFTCQYLLIT
jgi:hypothetical protein